MEGAVRVTILGPPANERAAALHQRLKATLQRELETEGAVSVLLSYSAQGDAYRIETATEHLGSLRSPGTVRVRYRVEDVRRILKECGASLDNGG
jgi:hypothetical protein